MATSTEPAAPVATPIDIVLVHLDNETPENTPKHLINCVKQLYDIHQLEPGQSAEKSRQVLVHLILSNGRAKKAFLDRFTHTNKKTCVELRISILGEIPVGSARKVFQNLILVDRPAGIVPMGELPLWRHSLARFFVIADYASSSLTTARRGQKRHLIHMENDVLLYERLDRGFADKLAQHFPAAAAPFDHPLRVIPSFVFFNDGARDTKAVANALLPIVAARMGASAHARFGMPVTDMACMADVPPAVLAHLPVAPPENRNWQHEGPGMTHKDFWRHAKQLGGVFDAAALGQYLFGTDLRYRPQAPGFVNETAVYTCASWTVRWSSQNGLKRLEVSADDGVTWHKVFCLHCHSKIMSVFMSVTPPVMDLEHEWLEHMAGSLL